MVIVTEWYSARVKDFLVALVNNLKANNINIKVCKGKSALLFDNQDKLDLKKYEMPVNINIGMIKYSNDDIPYLAKNIYLVNNTPPKIS